MITELLKIIDRQNDLIMNVAKAKGFTIKVLPYVASETKAIGKMIKKLDSQLSRETKS